ncbi:phage head-tail adapter protein [Brevundimonas sp. PAMC22021]|nr:phage head-tail adapter protein [Brevundimonas sp. PAMC22021]
MRVLAGLLEAVEAETPYGGRSVTFEALGSAWLKCGARRRRERADGDAGPRGVETLSAETRADPRLIEARVLRLGGADWRIVGVDGERRPGRVTLDLERMR